MSRTATRTDARELLGLLGGVVAVAVAAAAFAHWYREAIFAAVDWWAGQRQTTTAAERTQRVVVAVVVASTVFAAGAIARLARRGHPERLRVNAIVDAAHGRGVGPQLWRTLLAAAGTLLASMGLASLGREAPILETGGGSGLALGRRFGLPLPELVGAGLAAGFAGAYHAPVAAVLFVGEHALRGSGRRVLAMAALGSAVGYLVSWQVFRATRIFPGPGHVTLGTMVMAVLAVVPALIGTRIFFSLRERFSPHLVTNDLRGWTRSALLAAIAGATIAIAPLAAGNGMEAVRKAATEPTLQIALALTLAKTVATFATLGSGARGGVFTPSVAVGGGSALLLFVAISATGLALPGSEWQGMIAGGAIAISIGAAAPLFGIVAAAELSGDWRVLPVAAVAVLLAEALDRGVLARWRQPPAELDE